MDDSNNVVVILSLFAGSVHLCVTMPTCQPGVAQQLICDIKDCVRKVMLQPDVKCEGAVGRPILR